MTRRAASTLARRMGLLRLAGALSALALLALVPATASAAPPNPFGHACTPQDGVLFCPTTDLAGRVPSWDGTPIDVDVTLPATGDGPFPTIVLHHGLGGTKTTFEAPGASDPLYTNVEFAKRGFAVVTPTARGYGNSCGKPESRTSGCENGFTRLMDMRYEVRDVQHLLGVLVDEGVAKPDAIGSTGVSYGGGMSMMLAYLKNRVRQPDGSLTPWTSPKGTPISLAAAWPRWGWTNGAAIFTRNGRDPWSELPIGAVAKAYADTIFSVSNSAFVQPAGGDLSADITLWKQLIDQGAITGQSRAVLDNAYDFHGVVKLGSSPAPLLIQQGWTDALFPVPQALGAYDRLLRANASAPVSLQLGDLGHSPGANHPQDNAAFEAAGITFFEAWLQGKGSKPAPGAVTAYTMTCPKDSNEGGGPYGATRFSKLATRQFRITTPRRSVRITSKGGNRKLAEALSPVSGEGSDLCNTHKPDRNNRAQVSVRSSGMTLIGQPVIRGRAVVRGSYAGLIARLWDYDPKTRTQRLITRGVYRLNGGASSFTFKLDGNGWRFARGHRIVFELLGRDAPTYLPSPGSFSAKLSNLRFSLPVR